ncbi:ribonuclease Z [Psychroserpens sp.]|uniref:ribonuclease Z n=1 Tax=Psychroserpens sp. TaxID=2020870 RepID=UPI001B208B67|nr:ribonuclease Z [Psychroserpens sp.]MBO6607267.1 ribonuclease Z [Psychroserpens sp.]MBO6632088.1 ribonuclease Z [Psychroserpens sp.]MBO6654657.1 ribonuclease Z [Psychroserpens sp.]MBO6680996.1 ribonuclease Z [Psychroserpens sp.]MBO6750049.1 ribonuclease Z [Psychroserpens sp.]
MKLHVLGCYSATPRTNTNPTAQVLEINNHMFLIDCGEGTQVELRRNKIKFNRIKHIFISHLHGDHCFGLVGLISTFRLLTREADLHVYAPKGLKEVITLQMKLSDSWTNYKLIFHELTSNTSELIYEDDKVEVHTIPLDHRVYTNGFLFKEKLGERRLDMNEVLNADIDVAYYRKLKQGADVPDNKGNIVKNELVTKAPKPPKSYAFCSDTAYNESIVPIIKDVSVLYHESTFLEKNKKLAAPTKHSTAKEAATIAKKANAGQLILGHYSTRYDDLNLFKEEAQTIFENVELAKDGKSFTYD